MHFKMLSAVCFNLSSGYGLNGIKTAYKLSENKCRFTFKVWFDPRLGQYPFRGSMIVIATGCTVVHCFDNGYVGKQPVALNIVWSTG